MATCTRRTLQATAVALASMLFLLLVPAGTASAATNGQWAVSPSSAPDARVRRPNFRLDVRPGDRVSDAMEITNFTDKYMSFRLYAADAYNTPKGGAFALRGVNDREKDVATWVKLPVLDFTSPPHSTTKVPFTVDVPRDATPGEHVGGIVALNNVGTLDKAGDVNVNLKRAVGVRLYATVAGPKHPSLEIEQLSGRSNLSLLAPAIGGDGTIHYTVANTGNISLDATAKLKVKDVFGRTVKVFPARKLDGLLPHQHADVTERWADLPRLGFRLSPHLEVVAGSTSTSATGSFLAVPWLLVVVIVALIVFLVWRRRRRRRGDAGGPGDPPPEPIEHEMIDQVPAL